MIVLDASALVDAVIAAPHADWVLDQLAGQEVRSPAHQPAEVLSALSRLVRAGELEPADAEDALGRASALEQALVVPTAPHLRRAYVLRERVRVLDGLYVALAEDLGCPLVTTDLRLTASRAPCEVRAPGSPG